MKGTLKLRKPKKDNPQELYFHHYDLIHSEYSFYKETDKKGKIQSDVRSGNIKVVLAELPDDSLMAWVFDSYKLLNGEITIHDAHEESLDKISFEQGRCVDFRLHYMPEDNDATRSVKTILTINAQRMVVGDAEYINTGR